MTRSSVAAASSTWQFNDFNRLLLRFLHIYMITRDLIYSNVKVKLNIIVLLTFSQAIQVNSAW